MEIQPARIRAKRNSGSCASPFLHSFSRTLSFSATLSHPFLLFPVSRTYENLFLSAVRTMSDGFFSAYRDGNSCVGSKRTVEDQELRLRWEWRSDFQFRRFWIWGSGGHLREKKVRKIVRARFISGNTRFSLECHSFGGNSRASSCKGRE